MHRRYHEGAPTAEANPISPDYSVSALLLGSGLGLVRFNV